MTSSGTYDFALSNGAGVLEAFERIQIRMPSIRQEHMFSARNELNLLFSQWSNLQVNLWEVQLISVPLIQGTATYTLPAYVVMVLDAYISLNYGQADQTDLYITPISRTDYASYAAKSNQGQPNVYWLNRQITPQLTTYPVANSNDYVLNYYACTQIQDGALGGGQTPDIPYLWMDALVAGLAYRLARVYAPALEAQRKADAQEAWEIAARQNVENVPFKISPNIGRYYRR